jgi:hypothetical protein
VGLLLKLLMGDGSFDVSDRGEHGSSANSAHRYFEARVFRGGGVYECFGENSLFGRQNIFEILKNLFDGVFFEKLEFLGVSS